MLGTRLCKAMCEINLYLFLFVKTYLEGDAQLACWQSEGNIKVVSLHSDGSGHQSWWQVIFTLSPLVPESSLLRLEMWQCWKDTQLEYMNL